MARVPFAYCPQCGGDLVEQYVPDEERDRFVCRGCGRIHYLNPVVVAGTIPVTRGGVWLLRRAIEPRLGYWTFPAGYMELGETVEEAAVRETEEELSLTVRLERLLGVYSRPHMATVHVVYLAEALSHPSGGRETLEFAWFAPDDIPWENLAFWTTGQALREWLDAT